MSPQYTSGEGRSAGHPSCNALRSKPSHELQPSATHGKVADQVPNQSGQLEDRRDEGEEGVMSLQRESQRRWSSWSTNLENS